MSKSNQRRIAVVSIELVVAALLVAGANLVDPALRLLYQCYFADMALPFGFYFLLSAQEGSVAALRPWWAKALAVFALCATSETLQYFGIYALARVFDPVDYLMYGAGVLLAAFVDTRIFAQIFGFWKLESQGG